MMPCGLRLRSHVKNCSVLHPQMCYVDAAWGYSTEESHVRLQNTLTKEEFLVVSAMEQKKATPKIKCRLVELWSER